MSDLEVKIDSELCQIEETFSYMEHLSDSNDVSRPDSNVSFSSWTFSPITNEMSDDSGTQPGDVTKPEESTTGQQDLPPLQQMPQPGYCQPSCANYQPVNSLQQMTYPYEHYGQPNAVYHHSVNIHNYNVGHPAWSYDPTPVAYSVYNFNVPQVPQVEYAVDQHDPLACFNGPEAEYARCSTPEYIMALNSLNQIDSPPPIQSTAKTLPDCSYAPKVQDQPTSAPKHIDLSKQDSGYNSDLDGSLGIDYQDNHTKLPKVNQMNKKSVCTSTPAVYPVLRMASMIKENRQMMPRRLMPPNVLSMPGFVPKVYAGNQPSFVRSARVSQVASSVRQIQSEEISSSLYQRQNNIRFTSMADIHTAKKKASQEKRMAEEVISANKENSKTDQDQPIQQSEQDNQPMKRRRHNEPLNYMALQVMNTWYETHLDNPYPSKEQKEFLAEQGGITVSQVKSWFANKRNRSNNTRPKKQRKVMEHQLMNICHQLAQDARKPNKDNAYYIQQLSSIIDTTKNSISSDI